MADVTGGYSLKYKPDGPVLRQFMRDPSPVRLVRGPVGSGKSTCCVIECFRMSAAQEPGADGWRRTRGAIIRNTFPELKTTTMNTWKEWFPEEIFGKIKMQPPMTHRIVIPEAKIEIEVIFLALDRDEDVKKLLSLELTWLWINEAREVPLAVVTAAIGRTDRYPSMRDGGGGATRPGSILDTNAPSTSHWWPIMSGEVPPPEHMTAADLLTMVRPASWKFFVQPPAMLDVKDKAGNLTGYELNPARENSNYIKAEYYTKVMHGQSRDWIRNMVQNTLGRVYSGRPVYHSYSEATHVVDAIDPIPGHPIRIGVDFGLTPAGIFGQKIRDRWLVFDELVMKDMGTVRFAAALRARLNEKYPGFEIIVTGDPAGDQRVQTTEETPFMMMRAAGFQALPAWTNDPSIRIEAWEAPFKRLVDGYPGILISRNCVWTIGVCAGGYHYRKNSDEAAKDEFSHPADAGQYMMLGGGEGKAAIGRGTNAGKIINARTQFNAHTGVRVSNPGRGKLRRPR
jgi:hypothetical protein